MLGAQILDLEMAKNLTTLTFHQQLKTTDLGEVLELLTRHGYSGTSYHDLGLFLGLSVNTIRVIEADHRGNTGRCLSECLTKWLEKVDNVQKKGGPTIYSLVSALRELGENGVAEGINNEIQRQRQRQPISPPKDFNPLIFEDEIYGDIIIDHPLIVEIIKTHQFQRLKDIKQLGFTYQNIPKANYSRLQHSIGMYYLAGEYVKQLQRKQPELNITESDVLCVQIAALCYNLGFGPFSHTFGLFLDEVCKEEQIEKPWDNVSEASVEMLDYMLEDNEDLMASFKKYFDNPEKNITFIKELMEEKRKMQCIKDKEFLYEIILNESQMNVKVIDYTTRDAAVLGAKLSFKWRVFLTKVRVLRCADGKLHICFHEDDLETYNDFFNTRSSLYRELYYLRKIRIVALIVKMILTIANNTELIPDTDRKLTVSDATRSMAAYTHLTDSIISHIRLSVKDKLAQGLLKCLDTIKSIAQIGYIVPPESWNKSPNDLKEAIVKAAGSDEIESNLIIDPVLNGYEGHDGWTQYFYCDDDSTGKWTDEWARKKYNGNPPWRVFLVSGNRKIMKTAQDALKKVIENEKIQIGKTYPDRENFDLMPDFPVTGASLNVPKQF